MFENLRNFTNMLGQARQLRETMEKLQEELGRKTVEGDAGAGAVRVTVNGKLEVVAVHFDRPLLTALAGEGPDADLQMVQDLIVAATNAALAKARELIQQEMMKLTGGMNLPGMDQMLGGQ